MVKLRLLREQDLPMVMEWRMKPEVTKYMYTNPKLDLISQKLWFENVANDKSCKYWIIEIERNIPVGVINLAEIDYVNKKCSWGYYIGSIEARGKGLARKLECNILDYIFDKLELNKLWCEVFAFNKDVVAIHEKFGSKVEGYLKQHILKDGIYYDVIRMGILKEEWDILKDSISYEKIEIEE